MSERFYSGEREGDVMVRESGIKRPLHNRFDYRKHLTEHSSIPSAHARLSFNLLADALDSEHHASQVHEYLARRIVPLLPQRFTISRSRLLEYVDIIDQEKDAQIGMD
jgi:hypothetical protein